MFVLSAGAYLWFFGSLRTFLQRAEGGPGMLSTIAFGAGIVTAGIQMVFQGLQVALAVASNRPVEPTLAALFSNAALALSVIAYVPMAVMLAAVAVVSLRHAVVGWAIYGGTIALGRQLLSMTSTLIVHAIVRRWSSRCSHRASFAVIRTLRR
jgi:hypothetical protein